MMCLGRAKARLGRAAHLANYECRGSRTVYEDFMVPEAPRSTFATAHINNFSIWLKLIVAERWVTHDTHGYAKIDIFACV